MLNDTDYSFTADMVNEIYDRISCPDCERVQVNFDADDDGRVIIIWLNTAGNTVTSIEYRHNSENKVQIAICKIMEKFCILQFVMAPMT